MQLFFSVYVHKLEIFAFVESSILHSDLNYQKLFHSTIDEPPGVPGVSKNLGDQTEVHSGELER